MRRAPRRSSASEAGASSGTFLNRSSPPAPAAASSSSAAACSSVATTCSASTAGASSRSSAVPAAWPSRSTATPRSAPPRARDRGHRLVRSLPRLAVLAVGADPGVSARCVDRPGRRRIRGACGQRPHDQVAHHLEAELLVQRKRPPVLIDHLQPRDARAPIGERRQARGQRLLAQPPTAVSRNGRHTTHPAGAASAGDQRKRGRLVVAHHARTLEVDVACRDVFGERGGGEAHRQQVVRIARVEQVDERMLGQLRCAHQSHPTIVGRVVISRPLQRCPCSVTQPWPRASSASRRSSSHSAVRRPAPGRRSPGS